jgi:hypothetical protein
MAKPSKGIALIGSKGLTTVNKPAVNDAEKLNE